MKIRTVTSLREFDQLATVWRDITDASGQRSPFVSHDWFASCWRTAGPHRRREVWIVEDAAGPLAIVPLLHSRAWYRRFPSRILQLMHAPGMPTADLPVARAFDEVAVALLDLDYSEDSVAEVDANVVMTGEGGLVEVQATAERTPLSRAHLDELLVLAAKGIVELRVLQDEAVAAGRS